VKSVISSTLLALFLLSAIGVDVASADDKFILATGRRDPRIYAIDFDAALKPQNNNTPNAVVSRSKVLPDRLDGTLIGDPANIVLSEDSRTAYVINHHGAVNNAEFLQHGGRGSVSVMDVKKMTSAKFDNTDRALEQSYDSGYFGAVGLLVLPDLLLVSHSENWLTEDGGNRISLIDRETGGRRGQIEMALGHPPHACPDFPVPFVSPTPPPVVPFSAPDPQFGCWPNPEFLALGRGSDGKTYLFSGNAGTNDVSVMDLKQALAGDPVVEIAPRIPVQAGPFGIRASPNGKLIAVTPASGPTSTSRGTQSRSSMWISPGWARQMPSWPESRSEPIIRMAKRVLSRSRGRPMAVKSSWRTIDRITCRLSTFAERWPMILVPRLRASRSFVRLSPTALSFRAIRKARQSLRTGNTL